MTLKVWILRCSRRLFIILVSLTMTWFSEKCLSPIDAYMVSCPTWSKNLGRTLRKIHFLKRCGIMFPLFSWKDSYLPNCTATEGKLSFVRNRKLAVIPGKLSRANKRDIFCVLRIMNQPTIKNGLRNTCDAVFPLASLGKINVLTNKS